MVFTMISDEDHGLWLPQWAPQLFVFQIRLPVGITWEELGLELYASYEELMEAYDRLDRQRENGMSGEDDEFWDEEDLF